MNILMITPKVDKTDNLVGVIHDWIENLSKRADKLYVICLERGMVSLPKNVELYSLGKERGLNKLSLILNFYRILFTLKNRVDVIFAQYSPIYTILASPFSKLYKVPSVLWYAHGRVGLQLRLAVILADRIVTSTTEACRIKSDKVRVIGQGINTDKFCPSSNSRKGKNDVILYSVGRISPIKNYETLIDAVNDLVHKDGVKNIKVVIIGGVVVIEHKAYLRELEDMVKSLNLASFVSFVGSVSYDRLCGYIRDYDIFVNLTPTGSFDKAVLEAMSCSKPVIVCNESFRELLKPYGSYCFFEVNNPRDLKDKIRGLVADPSLRKEFGEHNRTRIIKEHSVTHFTSFLTEIFNELIKKEENKKKSSTKVLDVRAP